MDGDSKAFAGSTRPPEGSRLDRADGPVRRRQVFYISGFDPQGPAHYHRLYADEGAKQARVSGYSLLVGGRHRSSPLAAGWAVEARFGTGTEAVAVESQVEFLRWDDIVRANWTRSRWRVMLGALVSTGRQVRNGVLWRVLKTSWPAFMVLAMPPLLVVVLGLLAALGSGLVAALLVRGFLLTAVLAGAAGAGSWWALARWAEARVQMAWLMRSTRFILRQARGATPDLEARIDAFGERIAAAWTRGAFDEVLVVGHSSGAMLAVSAVSRALAASRLDGGSGSGAVVPLSLLTLGECIPMLSYQPEAQQFRAELAAVARSGLVDWVDVTAPPDGCCFALVDPTAAAWRGNGDVAPPSGWRAPKLLSARFAQMFDSVRYAELRLDKYRCHFQYLMASDVPVDYDYFAITAGPKRLTDRFAAHRSVSGFVQFQILGGDRP
jgi:hypothetical protein